MKKILVVKSEVGLTFINLKSIEIIHSYMFAIPTKPEETCLKIIVHLKDRTIPEIGYIRWEERFDFENFIRYSEIRFYYAYAEDSMIYRLEGLKCWEDCEKESEV